MGNIKQINIKSREYYFFNDMINIKDFQSSFLKTDKKIIKNYWLRHNKKIEDFENINSVNPLYLIIGQVD